MAFELNINSWVYLAEYQTDGSWQGGFQNKEPYAPQDFAQLTAQQQAAVFAKRNQFPELCLVSYTSQYGLAVFEGLKAYPRADGTWAMFRPLNNCQRMQNSMAGILQPTMAAPALLEILLELMRRTLAQGVDLQYQPHWQQENFCKASSIYIRPFSYAEPGLGVNRSQRPWIVVVSTPVSGYFGEQRACAIISHRVRAMPGGTGWIKCASNYVISMLARHEAQQQGFMEALFLDGREQRYLEEGSSCNIFVLLKDGTLVTPNLGDTILPGITRDSVIQLAKAEGIKVEERPISLEELLSNGAELFATGTAAGLVPIHSVHYDSRTYELPSAKWKGQHDTQHSMAERLESQLKGIQYGTLPDPYNWSITI